MEQELKQLGWNKRMEQSLKQEMEPRVEQRETAKAHTPKLRAKNVAAGRLGLGVLCMLSLSALLGACYVEEDGWEPMEKDGKTILVKQKNIETVKEHLNKPEGLTEHYKLTEDIRLKPPMEGTSNWVPVGKTGEAFTGVFDGNGHSISGITITRVGGLLLPGELPQGIGMFGSIGQGAEIKNIELKDVNINYTDKAVTDGTTAGSAGSTPGSIDISTIMARISAVGGVVGQNDGGTVQNCSATGNISSNSLFGVGGVVGANNQEGVVKDSHFSGNVQGNNNVGGVVGWNNNSTVENCHSAGSVKGNTSVGGAVGTNNAQSSMRNCHSSSAVEGQNVVGGLLGMNADKSMLTNSYATGPVQGKSVIGGLVGANDNSEVYDAYATGDVNAADYAAGGVAGANTGGGRMERVYAKGHVNGRYGMGGVLGSNGNSSLVKDCYALGNVRASQWFAGGVAAFNMGTVQHCYAVGRVAAKGGKGKFLGLFGKKLEAGIGGIIGVLGQKCEKETDCLQADGDDEDEGTCESQCKQSPKCKAEADCNDVNKEKCQCEKDCEKECEEIRQCEAECDKKLSEDPEHECEPCMDEKDVPPEEPVYDNSAHVIGCMALNWAVVAHKHNNKYSWRIVGGWKQGTAENNYAYGWLHTPEMLSWLGDDDRDPRDYLYAGVENSKYGKSIIPRQWPLDGDNFPPWFREPPWTHVPGKLPGFGGSAVDIPDHIIWSNYKDNPSFRYCWKSYPCFLEFWETCWRWERC